jgi:hypothetical protein
MKRAPHPAYSPDIAPSDFFLFGYIKEKQRGKVFDDTESLLQDIKEIFKNMEKGLLSRVYKAWIERMKWVITHHGVYYQE